MKSEGLSDKERALLQAARKEAAARKAAEPAKPAGAKPQPPPRGATPLDGRTVVGWDHPAAKVKPARTLRVDAPTVAGWDHPGAKDAPTGDADKWDRLAALMEAEREESREKRRRAQRTATIFLGILFVLVLFAGARILAR
jgi:hypothetical protein